MDRNKEMIRAFMRDYLEGMSAENIGAVIDECMTALDTATHKSQSEMDQLAAYEGAAREIAEYNQGAFEVMLSWW